MNDLKQVKVDNWGIFFLQRLKHFFNRTDYCDLTLQFQDNAQLKVHRLVLSACTEYFELLERTCEMYEDCLVMPDDLQADVVVPIVNFMYTGQLEFKMELLERLHQTSLVMNMPVLTKLLDSHRNHQVNRAPLVHSYANTRRSKTYEASTPSSSSGTQKRSYTKAFESINPYMQQPVQQNKTYYKTPSKDLANILYLNSEPSESPTPQKQVYLDPRPTRYELPEELESDNLFDNSFTNISYTSKPLMVHPETTKRYPPKRTGIFEDPSTSKRFIHGTQTMDIVECKKISVPAEDNIFEDDMSESMCDDPVGSNQLFDQILDNGGPKVTIETKDNKASNLDHAKIISEVLKKYPHLVKSNKNIKLKILNTPSKKKGKSDIENVKEIKQKSKPDLSHSYESEVIDSKEAAKLIALGAENICGPWICLICGAPGKAIHFTSYYKFRRHLVETHNEKPIPHICEYCGQKAVKRNFMLHHLYVKHGVEPPPHVKFPKCNICNYIALNEGLLIKHKLSHVDNQSFRCNVCNATFSKSNQLLTHIQKTGHKYSDKRTTYQCIYCLKTFTRESNLYAHLRIAHKDSARTDGILDMSEEEREIKEKIVFKPTLKPEVVKYEVPVTFDNEYDDADIQYQIQQQPDGNIQLVSKKPKILMPAKKHKILNSGLDTSQNKIEEKTKLGVNSPNKHIDILQDSSVSIKNQREEILMIDENEYIVKNNCLIAKKDKPAVHEGYSMPDLMHTDIEDQRIIPTSIEFTSVQTASPQEHKMIVNKTGTVNQPIQIVVSNEEEYKALMSSNHSIIFEDGGGGKTLTVLTAPQDNNTTIDLDNSQSNDMMIIPDNYPLNVSQAVSGDNSNIVVVYSHAVDDQSKEFQLNLGTQYVTSSGIITQNYETVTTSAPVMNSHIIESPVEDSWQNNIPQSITPVTELDIPISNNQEITIAPTDNQHNLIDSLQEEQLTPDNSLSVEMQSSDKEVINTNIEHSICDDSVAQNINKTEVISDSQADVANSEIQPTFINAVDPVQSNLNIDANNQNITSQHNNDSMNVDQPSEDLNIKNKCSEDSVFLENVSVAEEIETESSPNEQIVDDTQSINTECSTDAETIENIAKEIQSSASMSRAPNETVHVSVDIEPVIITEIVSTKAKEQIENLTSEWSDDEIETSSHETQINSQEGTNLKNSIESEAMETDSQADVEESIENIQQEMEKQLTRPLGMLQNVNPLQRAEDETSSNTDNLLNIGQETEPITEPIIKSMNTNEENKPPLKISSLLNDWDDNESQEENVLCVNENKEGVEPIMSNDNQNSNNEEAITETVTNKSLINAGENIKSLVSDWVEDDEDEETENK